MKASELESTCELVIASSIRVRMEGDGGRSLEWAKRKQFVQREATLAAMTLVAILTY